MNNHDDGFFSIKCTGGKGGKEFFVDSIYRIKNISDIAVCKKALKGHIENTYTLCSSSTGLIYRGGFSINIRNNRKEFLPLYEVCYDSNNMITKYTSHTIHGAVIEGKMTSGKTGRKSTSFDADEIAKQGYTPNLYYTQIEHKAFIKGLVDMEVYDALFNSVHYQHIQKGHLTPYADFVMRSWQVATNNMSTSSLNGHQLIMETGDS